MAGKRLEGESPEYGVIVSGGNVAPELLAEAAGRAAAAQRKA